MLPVLQANGLTKAYGRHQVLSDITLQIAAGTLVGIVGENGAGKSTLLNLLAGALAPTRGSIQIAGTLGYCPQTVILNEALTVAQHLDYFQAAYHLASNASADRLIERLRFAQYRAAPVSTLSGGTKQKLNLTLALMHDPSILLLDEPYQGFDWETYLQFWDLAQDLRQRGCAVLVISHLFFDRQRFDQLYQLQHGTLVNVTGKEA